MIFSCNEPGFDPIASQLEEDIEFHREHANDWYLVDESFNDIPLHDIFYEIVKDMRLESENVS
jgi:hypothetical protein